MGVLREGMEQIATQYKLERMLLHKCARPAGPQEGPEQNTQVLGKWGGGRGTGHGWTRISKQRRK